MIVIHTTLVNIIIGRIMFEGHLCYLKLCFHRLWNVFKMFIRRSNIYISPLQFHYSYVYIAILKFIEDMVLWKITHLVMNCKMYETGSLFIVNFKENTTLFIPRFLMLFEIYVRFTILYRNWNLSKLNKCPFFIVSLSWLNIN